LSKLDEERWQARYAEQKAATLNRDMPLAIFTPFANHFPTQGRALEIACGRGAASIWLARRGMEVYGVDIAPAAIKLARELALRYQLSDRCQFDVHDLDQGLPPSPQVDLVLCHNFRDPRLYPAMSSRLKPGGMIAIATLSEVGSTAGPFRAEPCELKNAFGELDLIGEGEADGRAWLVAQRPDYC
jgi:2-polyprenyl-3-methyl-5-hydroxy-6-metoxy-1,4-benzoquinol methylase